MAVSMSGPMFDGRAQREADALLDEIVRDVSQEAFEEVHAALDQSLKNPTGYYESQIRIDRQRDSAVVSDGGVVYGPWLAGVSSRNDRSRFKGYAHWRRARQRTEAQVRSIAQPKVSQAVKRMNGR